MNQPQNGNDTGTAGYTLADAHVHIYRYFDLQVTLDCAWSNFSQAAAGIGLGAGGFDAMLMLAEKPADHFFDDLLSGTVAAQGWRFESAVEEPVTIVARRSDGPVLHIVAGFQLVSAERLEILALATRRRIANGASAADLLRTVHEDGALPVLPWGVGKWLGRRGTVVANLIEDAQLPPFFLGDNGGRLAGWPAPGEFAQAAKTGKHVLPGSDPLPHASECWRPGSSGFVAPGRLDPRRPAGGFTAGLRKLRTQPRRYGRLERLPVFLRNQIRAQVRKRLAS